MKLLCSLLSIGIAFIATTAVVNAQILLTFDDLPTDSQPGPPGYSAIPNGYGGLNWNNFGVLNGLAIDPSYGYHVGVVSSSNVAFNVYGDPASIAVSSGLFDLNSAYLTAALNLNTPLNIQVQGFVGATMLYNNTYTVNNSGPTLINFNYIGVENVTFTSSPAQQFAMDNVTVTVPEPATDVLTAIAAVISGLGLRRKRSK